MINYPLVRGQDRGGRVQTWAPWSCKQQSQHIYYRHSRTLIRSSGKSASCRPPPHEPCSADKARCVQANWCVQAN